jgi:hypothetical protein
MIKRFDDFINEVSGVELVGPEIGMGFGTTPLNNNTISSSDTLVISSDINNKMYTLDDYNQLYQDYLKSGGGPLDGFTKENLDKIIFSLQEQQ